MIANPMHRPGVAGGAPRRGDRRRPNPVSPWCPPLRWALLLLSILSMIPGSASRCLARELRVVDPRGLSGPDGALLASIQGVLNRTGAVVWVRGPGMNARILDELRAEGWTLREAGDPWSLLRAHPGAFSGAILGEVGDESLNRATTLAGLSGAVVADPSWVDRLKAEGLPVLADARDRSTSQLWAEVGSRVARGVMIHQDPSKALPLRDLAVSLGAWTVYDEPALERSRQVCGLGPHTRVYGWGRDELEFVREVSRGGGAVIPADWSLNLSALRHLPVALPVRPRPGTPRSRQPGERVVAFVVSDGDNLQWVGGRFVDDPGFWASPLRGRFAVTWEMPPEAWTVAPRILRHLLRTATPRDDVIVGSSGFGYQFPGALPDRPASAAETAHAAARTDWPLVTLLNADGGQEQSDPWLERPEIQGVLYKDYAPYNRARGAVRWHRGKPSVSYRFLLWELKDRQGKPRQDWLPDGVAGAVAGLSSGSDAGAEAFALVNVHAWSFRDSGGPMAAIGRTIEALPPRVRVVTATEFFALLAQEAPDTRGKKRD